MNINLVQISFGDGYAGSARMAILSSNLLSKINYNVTLFVSRNSLTEKRATDCGLNIFAFDTTTKFKFLFNEVNKVFNDICPQAVISHHSLDRKIGMRLKQKYGKNILNIAYRHNVTKSTPLIGPLLYNHYFDLLIACSNGVAQSLISSGIKKSKIKVLHNGISVPSNIEKIDGKNIRNNYSIDDKIVLGLSTWFHKERKGFDILFEAFSQLDDNYVLFLVGVQKSDQQNVLEFANEFGISSKNIVMPGYVENIWEYYKAMDIFLLPSRSEGFSLALLEAATAKLPIIASDIPGNNEFIINNENGILFDLKNPDDLKNAIVRLSNNKLIQENISQNAHKKVLNKFTETNYVNSFNTILREKFTESLNQSETTK
jgi:glycosyltransferase involved in cell wall biosynthesis